MISEHERHQELNQEMIPLLICLIDSKVKFKLGLTILWNHKLFNRSYHRDFLTDSIPDLPVRPHVSIV